MKTTKIVIKNLFGIKETELDGRSVEISGPKGSGKTSVLDSIRYALTNRSDRDYIVHRGADEGEIIIETDTGLSIDRKALPAKSAGTVKVRDGSLLQTRPAEFLSQIFTPLQLNPVEFTQLSRQEKNRVILNLIEFAWDTNWIREQFGEIPQGVDYSKHILEVLHDIQAENGVYFQSRQNINRDIRNKQAFVSDIAKDIPSGYDFDHWNTYPIGEKYRELESLKEQNNVIERARAFRNSHEAKLRGLEGQRDLDIAAIDRKTSEDRTRLTTDIERLKAEIRLYEERLAGLDERREESVRVVISGFNEKKAKLERDAGIADQYIGRELADTTALSKEIDTAEAMRKHLNEYQFRSVSKEAEKARKEIENLDTKANKSMNSSGGIGGGFKSITNALVTMQAAQMIGGAVQGSLNTKIGSALGSDSGTLASSMISSVLSGAITGSAFGPLGVLAGATVGGITGAISGSAQRYESQDSSFKSYVQDAVQEQLDAQSESLTSGSSIAAGRETDKISFATLFGSKETADSYLTNLVGMANSTPFLYDDLTSMSKTLATYGYDADSILPVLQTIGDAGAALGQSTNDMTAVATAIGRMKSSNKTTLEYLNILNDRGIGAVGMLSDAYGVDQGTMYSMISKGEVAGQDAARIILDALSDSFAGSMEAQSKTFRGITSTIEGLQQELDNAMGEGYNQTRMQGLEAQKEWLAGDSGQEMQEAYTAIGAWKASLENAKEQYIRDAMNDAMGSEAYKTAEAEGDAAEMGRILMKAKIDGMNEYNANEGKDEELAQELSLIESVRDDTALNNSYWNAGYTLGQEFSKGRAAATTDSAWADAVNNFNSGYTKHRSGHQRAMGIDYVPYDNFPALLHEGEKVLTAGEARQEKNGVGGIQIVINGMTVREDADIDRVAQALLSKLEAANMRG